MTELDRGDSPEQHVSGQGKEPKRKIRQVKRHGVVQKNEPTKVSEATPTKTPEDFGASTVTPEDLAEHSSDSVVEALMRKFLGQFVAFSEQNKTQLEDIRFAVVSQTTAINQLLEKVGRAGSLSDEQALMKMIDAMEKKLVDSVNEFNTLLNRVNGSINQEKQIFESNKDMIALFMREIERMQEAQGIPESLRLPSLDRMADKLKGDLKTEYETSKSVDKVTGKETHKADGDPWDVKNNIYQNMVENWFEEHIRAMESSELAFEEQPDMYRYLSLYASNFAKTDGMRDFGEKIVARLESRRIRHRAVRVLSLSPPDAVVGELQKFQVPEMSNFFRDNIVGTHFTDEKTGKRVKGEDGKDKVENQVEKELRNYERMMRILRERRDKYRKMYLDEEERMKKRLGVKRLDYKQRQELSQNPELDRLSDEIKAKERYIVDYYKYGGHIDDKGIDNAYKDFVDESGAVVKGKWNEKLGDESNDNEEGFFYKLGTVDSRGERIGKYTVKDLVKSHIKEGTDKVKGSHEKEKELRDKLWARRYAGGTSSLMLRVSREAQVNGTVDFYLNRIYNFGDKVAENFLLRHTRELWDPTEGDYAKNRLSLEYVDMMSDMLEKASKKQLKDVGINNKRKDLNGAFLSFENLEWGSEVLWDDLIQGELMVNPATPSVKGTYVGEADGMGRKPMWGPDSLLHGPTVEKTAAIEHMGGWIGTGAAELFSLPGSDKLIEVSKPEKFQIGLMDRSLNNLRSDEARDQLGDPIIGYAEKATMCEWINSWVKHGMIDSKVRDILFEKYLGTTSKTKLRAIATVDVILSDWKTNWGTMTMQGFGEFLKRLLAYLLADEGIRV